MAPLTPPPKKTNEQMKKDLENKIFELEGKLSQLSNQLGKKPEHLIPSLLKKNPPFTPEELRHPLLGGFMSPGGASVRISEADSPIPKFENEYLKSLEERNKKIIESLDPDGSAKRQLLALAEESYQKDLNKKRGTLPKGFDGELKSPFSLIMSYDKNYAKFLVKSNRCLGCRKYLDKGHIRLCHECANDRLSELEFKQVIRQFTKWGFYKKPFLTGIALKLRLAKVITEEKHERKNI